MNWQLLWPLLVTTVVAIGGWIVAHYFTSRRDLKNKRREIRSDYLVQAYRRLEAGACRGPIDATSDYGKDFESAVADVQLFGTEDQIRMAKDLATSIAEHRKDASAGTLLLSLRDALRQELDLGTVNEEPIHFRLNQGVRPATVRHHARVRGRDEEVARRTFATSSAL